MMIHSRITSKAQTTVPAAVRRALGADAGDELAWELDGNTVTVRRVVTHDSDGPLNPFAVFTEWASEADCRAYDDL